MDGGGLLDRTMIPDFPIPDFGIPNSEIRMAYGNLGIPHHEIAGRGGGRGARAGGSWTGCNGVGHGMSYTNSGVGHGMSGGVPGHLVLNRK